MPDGDGPGGGMGGHGHGGPPWMHDGWGPPGWGDGPDLGWFVGPAALITALMVAILVFRLVRAIRSRPDRRPVRNGVRARWEDAVATHAATSRAYAAFECDPAQVLARPSLCDVSWPATARFVDAFAEAGALHTESYPGDVAAAEFVRAADASARAWTAAVDAAERARWSRFRPGERALLGQAERLLATAKDSPFEEERRTAYRRLAQRLAELERRTGWAVPRPVTAALAVRGRPMLEQGGRHRRQEEELPAVS